MIAPYLSIEGVTKSFGSYPVLNDLTLKCLDSEITVLLGTGGSGKSTILKIAAGIETLDQGKIIWNLKLHDHNINKDKPHTAPRMGFLFQKNALFDSLTVADNINFRLVRENRKSLQEIKQRVDDVLTQVRLPGIEQMSIGELSGGMQKRVGLARSIVHDPDFVFLDEPTAGLDPVSTDTICKLILRIQAERNIPMLVVSTELDCALKIANRVALLLEGKIYCNLVLSEFIHSQDEVIRQYLDGSRFGPIKMD